MLASLRITALVLCTLSALVCRVAGGDRGGRLVHSGAGVSADEPSAAGESAAGTEYRQREGTRMVKQQGYFRATGERLTFHVSGSEQKYLGLENLAMERIAKVVSDRHDRAEQLLWEVTGVLTEYRGNNYLLITHAILKTQARQRRSSP